MELLSFCKKIGLSREAVDNVLQVNRADTDYETIKKLFDLDKELFYKKILEKKTPEVYFLYYYCRFACETFEQYKRVGIEDEIFWNTFLDIKYWCENCYQEYGIYGIHQYDWFFRLFEMKLFRLGRLEFEIEQEEIKDSQIIWIHIPQGQPLHWKACEDSFCRAYKWFGKDKKYICHSWLLYPDLQKLLSKESNILKFQSRFNIYKIDYCEKEGEWRLFGKVLEHAEDYPENTSLRKAAKNYLLNGGKLGNGWGILRSEGHR